MPRAAIVSLPEPAVPRPASRIASFSSAQRLHRPEEFSAVMAARRVLRGELFDLHYRQTGADGCARLGLIVPKRLARAASLRNAIKRQAREAFRLALEVPRCDLVLRLTRPVKGVTAKDEAQRKSWRMEMETLLKRLPQSSP